MQSEQMTKWLG